MQKITQYFIKKILLKYYLSNPQPIKISDQQTIEEALEVFNYKKIRPCSNDKNCSFLYGMTAKEYKQEVLNLINNIIIYLKKDDRIIFANLLEKMLKNMDIVDVFVFLQADRYTIPFSFKNIEFTKEEIDFLMDWPFHSKTKANFFNCAFDIDYATFATFMSIKIYVFERYYYGRNNNNVFNSIRSKGFNVTKYSGAENFHDCYLSADSYANYEIKRVSGTPFTCQTSAYVKLGNKCNGSCSFCKNNSENVVKPNLNNIINSLFSEKIIKHLNEIYFGGGEPSLYIKEIKTILDEFKKREIREPKWYIYTNGSGNWHDINQLREGREGKIILSRQEIEDKDNEKIMGVTYSLNDAILDNLMHRGIITFALTYSEENMRENFLQEYIQFGYDHGIRNFIIQDLEEKSRENTYASDEHFKKLELYLEENGYKKSSRIASSSYFNLNIFYKLGYSISLKRYFSPNQLKEQFKFCPKHSFDLGIDANGDVYEDFQMIKKLEF